MRTLISGNSNPSGAAGHSGSRANSGAAVSSGNTAVKKVIRRKHIGV